MFRPKLLGNGNTSPLCSTGDAPNALAAFGNLFSDHMGPYDGGLLLMEHSILSFTCILVFLYLTSYSSWPIT